MSQEQYEAWFSAEQQQVTHEKKQKLLSKKQEQQQQQQQQQTSPTFTVDNNNQKTSLYIQRQLSQQTTVFPVNPQSQQKPVVDEPGVAPIFREPLRGLRLTEGTDAILQCSVIGSPTPKIAWLYNKRPVSDSLRVHRQYTGSLAILKISMMTPEDSGEYVVIAENDHGSAQNSARIEVYPLNNTLQNAKANRFEAKRSTTDDRQHPQQQKQQREKIVISCPAQPQQQPTQQHEGCHRENRHQQQFEHRQQREQQLWQEKEQQRLLQEQQDQQRRIVEKHSRQQQEIRQQREQEQLWRNRVVLEQQHQQQKRQQDDWRRGQQRLADAQRRQQLEDSRKQFFLEHREQLVREAEIRPRQQQQQRAEWQEENLLTQLRDQAAEHHPIDYGSANTVVGAPWRQQQQQSYRNQEQHPETQRQHTQFYHDIVFAPQNQQPNFDYAYDFEESSPHVHPYKRLPEQLQYVLQQQQLGESKMAPVQQGPKNGVQPPPTTSKSKTAAATKPQAQLPQKTAGAVKPPEFTQMPEPVNVQLGETAVFTAKAVGQPTPSLNWFLANGKPLPTNTKKIQIVGNAGESKLTINQITESDLGGYTCVARNTGGAFQAQFEIGVSRNKRVATGQNANVSNVSVRQGREENGGQAYELSGNKTDIPIKRQRFQPSPSAGPREQVTLRKVDRSKQFQNAKLLARDEPPKDSIQAPQFTSPLKNAHLCEGQHALLDCKFTPVDDPNLKIAWLLNGKAILASSRITTLNEYGYAVLEINPVTVFDHGEYTIVAVNPLGEARQSATIEVVGPRTDSVTNYLQSNNQNFVEVPPALQQPACHDRPNFHAELRSQELFEGQPLHLETKLTPINDPSLKVEFYLNGNLIANSDRVQTQVLGGFAVLQIAKTQQSDAGHYFFRAVNEVGSAETTATVVVLPSVDVQPQDHSMITSHMIDVEDVRELQSAQKIGQNFAPKFATQLQDFHCEQELGRSYFQARITPVNDPSLRVNWLKDDKTLPNANRIQTVNNVGFVSLTIHPTYPRDAGMYTCQLINSNGKAQSSANLTTVSTETLQLDSFNEQSLQQISEIEEQEIHIGPVSKNRPEETQSIEPPRFVRPLGGGVEVNENEPVHFECRILPANDVKMNVEWYHNGSPLLAAHRFRPMFDFGYIALDLLYAYPEDSGTYTVIARNELGEAQSSVDLQVIGQKILYLDAQHPAGLERIQELEQPKDFSLPEVPDRECDNPPKFLNGLPDLQLQQHDDINFELKLTPINDPTMVVEWFLNDQPLFSGSRIHQRSEFGVVQLTVRGVIPEDAGVYSVRAHNALGEDTRQCTVEVEGAATVLADTQHGEALGKIEYLENLNKFPREEVPDIEPTSGPQFVQPLLADLGEVGEDEPLHLECKVEPIGDNTLTIHWLRDGQPLPHSHRFRTFYNFGFVSLDILHVYAEDSGTYTCVAENALGRAETASNFTCQPKAKILDDTQHPESYARIRKIEAPKPLPDEVPEPEKQTPFFTKELASSEGETSIKCVESNNVFLEAQAGPAEDNTLQYEWLFNDAPLQKAHRFVLSQEFGFAALNILYVYPEDSGVYTLVIRNTAGEVRSSVQLDCEGKAGLLSDTFHPSSIARIKELEAPRPQSEAPAEAPKQTPQILTPLVSDVGELREEQSLHLEAQYAPVNDNTLKMEWFHNGAPLHHSNRHRVAADFGYAALDISFLLPQDAGEYALVISNEAGQARTATTVTIEGGEVLLLDTNHPESLRRIEEIETVRPAEPTDEELPAEAPQFTQELSGAVEAIKESEPLHLDCTLLPINDPRLRVEWFHNGEPLQNSARIRTIHDFGYVALEFMHVLVEDAGKYVCRAVNEAGEATTALSFQVATHRNLYLESQHEESWMKIQEIENRRPVREATPELSFPPPTFTTQLESAENLIEGQSLRLICHLQPVNDPTLKVTWTCNGQSLPESSRFMPARNLDLITLDISAVYGEDSGLYSCQAVSAFGETTTSCTVKCAATDAILLDTQHQESWNQIQELESRRPPEPIVPEPELVAPQFVTPLPGSLPDFQEGDAVHVEALIEPTNDNRLTIEWLFNGAPLANGHRFRLTHDFGYVALDILYAFAQDSGEYTCVLRNDVGKAQSSVTFQVAGKDSLYFHPQNPDSWQRIQELEAPKPIAEKPELEAPAAPQFIEPLQSLERIEGQPAHFQTRVTPINDNRLTIQWLKDGQPLANSNRHSMTKDFGLIALTLSHTVAADAGIYSVVARNEQSEARVDAKLSVQLVDSLLLDTQHEASWRRIQEIEAPKERPDEAAEPEHGPPHFTQQLQSVTDLIEGQPAHFEAQVQPIADPNLVVQWYHNGRPLAASNRIAYRNDFGLVTLDLQYALPQDIGDFRCVARNAYGEDSTEARLECERRPGLQLETQHKESWRRVQELEAPRPISETPEAPEPVKPQFTQPLQSLADVQEGAMALFEARLIPVGDSTLQVQWFLDDAPLRHGNRFTITEDFGLCTLRIAGAAPHDAGVYSCKAVNKAGAAITSALLSVVGENGLVLDTAHPISYQRIQELEALDKSRRLDYPEKEFGKPAWVSGFDDADVDDEGGIVELRGTVEPADDPELRVEWFLNGVPLQNANRFRSDLNFGQVTLWILHVLPHDSGVYSCRAYNAQGEDTTSATVRVAGYEAILRDTQHPNSWERIQELEAPRIVEEVGEVVEKEKPRFLTQIASADDVPEGTPIRLEATFQPARDNDLQVEWSLNGHTLPASQLIRTKAELGWACLDISAVNPDHNGVYTLRVWNFEGEAVSSGSIKVAGVGDILGDTQHEESWRRIQELEAPCEKSPSPPPPDYGPPSITKQIEDVECAESEPTRFEAAFLPNNDPGVKVQWVRNGEPLAHGSKYAISHDFGFCTLTLSYTFPEDEGVYQLFVRNSNGEAVTSATLKCQPKEAILGDVQHEESWRRIQELEAPKEPAPELEPAPKKPPRFTQSIQNSASKLAEGQPAHFETTVEPVDDPELRIQWFLNGASVSASSRVKMIADFGWVILNIADVELRDAGDWECVATNSAGEARLATHLDVTGKDRLLLDPINEQSLGRIRELEAPKPTAAEPKAFVYAAPSITAALAITPPADLAEGDSAHLEAQFTPIDDPNLQVEWYRDNQLLHHSNRYKMLNDFGFAILDILYMLAHDAGEYTVCISNAAGQASASVHIDVATKEGLILHPQNEAKARAVQELEDARNRRVVSEKTPVESRVPVFVEPLSAPVECESGERAHFAARYEPLGDSQLQVQWLLNNRPLITGSRVKTLNELGYVVLEIFPVYPEDSGDYVCRAVNAVGEAVTQTRLDCKPREGIDHESQLPEGIREKTQQRIHEIETRRSAHEEKPDTEYGPPRFVNQLPSLPQLREGALIHLDAQLEPVGDPNLMVQWFHNGEPVRNTARMKAIHDFGFVVFELLPAEPQDTGEWLCRASNAQGQAETSCQIEVVGDSGIIYDWVSPGERRERIDQLEEWINRPKDTLVEAVAEFDAPCFTEQLVDLGELGETETAVFMCVLEPIGDPTLKIEWLHDGHAIPYSNRIILSNDFGVATLTIKHLLSLNAGKYTCMARNAKGSASTTGQVAVRTLVDVDEPTVLQPLVDSVNAAQGESVYFECRVAPINDPRLRVEWLRDGQPLPDANRFQQQFEFGFATLNILYAYPEDNGEYELRVTNDKGSSSSKAQLVVAERPALEFTPQAPGANVDNLEHHLRQFTRAPLALSAVDVYDAAARRPPEFRTQLRNVGVEEGEFGRFEAQLAPINDPYMRLEWFKDGRPVIIGTRFRSTLDFGFACLDLLYTLPDDTGEYECVATNRHGQARLKAKLACAGRSRVVTDSQIPQNVRLKDIRKKENQNLHWIDRQGEQPRQKQAPQFSISPRDIQVNENSPARFECAIIGYPRPKVIWYINGHQAIHGHRYKLAYDGVHYLTITHARISDVGTIEAIARNSEGECIASANLDVFQTDNFRQQKLRPVTLKTSDELHKREVQWQKETLGSLGEAFERAPKGDVQKLVRVERAKVPIEPLETEELVQKFTRVKDEKFYNKLNYVEKQRSDFPGLELEPVDLKPGRVERYVPPKEEMERVQLRNLPADADLAARKKQCSPPPDWAAGCVQLVGPTGRFTQLDEPERELHVPARDQVTLKGAKPRPADNTTAVEHVRISEERARLGQPRQGPPVEPERIVPHAKQVQLKAKFQPKKVDVGEPVRVDADPLKDTPPVVKQEIDKPTISNKPQPTKMVVSAKAAPSLKTALKPIQAEIGRAATFSISYGGNAPVIVKWFHNGRELQSAFDTQIQTTDTESRLNLSKLKKSHEGEYSVKLSNVAGECDSTANLTVTPASAKDVALSFQQRIRDQRVAQNETITFTCTVTGQPRPIISWFKDGKQLPNDERYQQEDSELEAKLTIAGVLPPDAGIYECVAKNAASEIRCKARLNVNLAKTGKGAESGPKLEAPRFTAQIQPVVGTEGASAEFRAKYTGDPEPSIRWYRNNEPVKTGPRSRFDTGHSNGEAWLKLSGLTQEDVAEYKCDAINTAGKATTITNLVLKPTSGRVIGGKPGVFSAENVADKATGSVGGKAGALKAPQFLQKLTSINAKAGENVMFVAEFDGQPAPTVQWTFNSRPLPAGKGKAAVADGRATLELAKVAPAQAGSYACAIRNASGAVQSEAKLIVQQSR